MTDDHMPTDDHVREDFAYPWEGFTQDREGRLAAFDRWLAAHDARVRRAVAREALDSLAYVAGASARAQQKDNDYHAMADAEMWLGIAIQAEVFRNEHYPKETTDD